MKRASRSILITGATGFLGSLIVEQMIGRYPDEEITLILPVRDEIRAEDMYRKYADRRNRHFVFTKCDITNMDIDGIGFPKIDSIIHCAAVTDSAYMVSHPVETADGIVLGTKNILELARKHRVTGMVYLSSMEVYGVVDDIGRARTERELGQIDLEAARSCYPLAKRMAEHYCHIYHQQYGVPVRIARLAQTFGKGIRPKDRRVFMQFARAAREGRDIVLKTAGRSLGNYCASEDVLNALFIILEKGADGEVYNVVNEECTMSIRQMAELVAETLAEGKIAVRIEEEDLSKTGYAPETRLRMSSGKLRDLGWQPQKGLSEMYRDLYLELMEGMGKDT